MILKIRYCALFVTAMLAAAQVCMGQDQGEEEIIMKQEKLNGPRLGITYVLQSDALDREGTFRRKLEEKGIDEFISQFGWHFEWIVAPETKAPAFVVQLVPFFGGVEYGTLIPSLSVVLGVRMPMGFEFGMGPNALVTFDKSEPVSTSLLVVVGQSIKFGQVRIPLNLALATSRGGNRLSFVFGYAIPESRKKADI